MGLNVTMHKPESRIERAKPDDDISLGWHVDNVLDRRVTQVQGRVNSVAPMRLRAVLVIAHYVAIVVHFSRRYVEFGVADPDHGKAMSVRVDRVVGEESCRAVVQKDQLYGAVVRQFKHVGAVAAGATVLLGARSDMTDVVLAKTRNYNVSCAYDQVVWSRNESVIPVVIDWFCQSRKLHMFCNLFS